MILILVMAFFMLGCRFSCSGMREGFASGKTCVTDVDCESKWCHQLKCKARYEYEDKGYVCASNKECADGLFCDGGKCAWKFSSRNVGDSCNRGEQCKSHDLATGNGTQCCKKDSNANYRGPLTPFSVGQCTQKKKNRRGDYYCPGEVLFGNFLKL